MSDISKEMRVKKRQKKEKTGMYGNVKKRFPESNTIYAKSAKRWLKRNAHKLIIGMTNQEKKQHIKCLKSLKE